MQKKEEKKITKKKVFVMLLIVAILFSILGYGVGYGMGFEAGVSWTMEKAIMFLNVNGIDLGIDTDLLKEGVLQYKAHIDGWLNG